MLKLIAFFYYIYRVFMKKLLLISLLTLSMQNALANSKCTIVYNTGNEVLKYIVDEMPAFNFENFDEVCKNLKNANAKVKLTSISSISDNIVMDKNLPIYSDMSFNSMTWSQNRNTATEKNLTIDAVNNALNGITKEHINSLNKNRKTLGYKSY